MFKHYMMMFSLGHVLGDFYFQSETMAQKKDKSLKWLFIHCLVYAMTQFLVILPAISKGLFFAVAAVGAGHWMIDMAKFYFIQWKNKNRRLTLRVSRNLFFADQLLHGIFLVFVSCVLSLQGGSLHIWDLINEFFLICGIQKSDVLSWSLAILLIHKPVNIAIQRMLTIYRPPKKGSPIAADNNAGRFIGTVERCVMLILLAVRQYSAIALVLTAKSIARYDRISKESDFAEYYLLGTLLSLLSVIIVSFLIL